MCGSGRSRRLGNAINGDIAADAVVVTDVGHVHTRILGARRDRHRFPVLYLGAGQSQLSDHSAAGVEGEQYRRPRIIQRPQSAVHPAARGYTARFRELRQRRRGAVDAALRA